MDAHFDAEFNEAALEKLFTLRPVSQYHEDFGDVLWWHLPIQESPIVGGGPGAGEETWQGERTTCQRLHDEGWLTHWSPLPDPRVMREGAKIITDWISDGDDDSEEPHSP